MLFRDTKSISVLAYPLTATVALFLLRNRQIAEGTSPGSGVTMAGAELLSRFAAMFHAGVFIGERGLLLLLRVATTPAILAFTTLESEFRTAVSAIDGIQSLLQHASLYLQHML